LLRVHCRAGKYAKNAQCKEGTTETRVGSRWRKPHHGLLAETDCLPVLKNSGRPEPVG
jgi:hypothetical protein